MKSIVIEIKRQVLELRSGEQLAASYPISSSRFGLGTEVGSFRTPMGRFRICEKIGDHIPSWMVFKGRVPTGEIATPGGEEDHVLTRILWLEGLDEENENTKERYIYIHGTNQEDLIGTPASHGCIRLRNQEMIDLYDQVATGTEVHIQP
ncbi:MAG: L,D-transpeptidase [Verrucomicrobia bacterium]|nr:L,D-transpeptidase [Verrucomicrobiota bacterium]